MFKATAYLQLLFSEISDDLKNHVDGDKLQDEVQMEVEKQILSGLVQSVSEYNNCRAWGEKTKLNVLRARIQRNIEYVEELFKTNNEISGALGSGDSIRTAEQVRE